MMMRTWISLLAAGVAAGLFALSAGVSGAAGSGTNLIYWGDNSFSKISEANLDGSGDGGVLDTGTATVSLPNGISIDSAANKIYWVNAGTATIGEANLDGTGGGNLAVSGSATLNIPAAIAVDPPANKIFWVNEQGGAGNTGTISEANLDGSDSRDMNTGGATVNDPQGIAIDPQDNRIFWTNAGTDTISSANLDDTGGGSNLAISGTASSVNNPVGMAVDPSAGRIYWADAVTSGHISSANLNGSGSQDLSTTGATAPNVPAGVAIDPAANKIYWADKITGKISEANLDGSGDGHDLSTTGVSIGAPYFVALLEVPEAAGVPQITGGTTVGSTVSCSQGSWAPDLLGGFLYRAPHTYSYEWTLGGAPIAGATSSSLVAKSPGAYVCQVTAGNQAGSASETSSPVTVTSTVSPPPARPSLTHVSQSHKRWREGSKNPVIASARPPVGTTFRFTVNESVATRFTFTQRVHRRTVTRGKLSLHAARGTHAVRFQGRLSKHQKLAAGRYTLVISVTGAGGKTAQKTLSFTILKG
jgi:DNA-binding beta-propeller fold protein YncE